MASSLAFLLLLTVLSLASCAQPVTVTNCSDYLFFLTECHRNTNTTNETDYQLRKETFERKCAEVIKQNEDKAKGLVDYSAAMYCEYGDLPDGQEGTSWMTQDRSA